MPTNLISRTASLRGTVFRSGNSQAVRIPKKFQFNAKHVSITREGNALLIQPQPLSAAEVLADLPPLPATEALALGEAMALRHDLPALTERDLGFEPAASKASKPRRKG
jgi:antitoxin VapB